MELDTQVEETLLPDSTNPEPKRKHKSKDKHKHKHKHHKRSKRERASNNEGELLGEEPGQLEAAAPGFEDGELPGPPAAGRVTELLANSDGVLPQAVGPNTASAEHRAPLPSSKIRSVTTVHGWVVSLHGASNQVCIVCKIQGHWCRMSNFPSFLQG